MARKNPHVSELEGIAKRLAKVKPGKLYEPLQEAFLVFAAAGQVEHARAMIRLLYEGGLPPPKDVVHALGTGPMDGFCVAANLGDRTKGQPAVAHLASARTLEERVRISEAVTRQRLTMDAYGQFRKTKANWSTLTGQDLYRKAQLLARPGADGAPPSPDDEREALAAMTKYMDAWCGDPEDRGSGYGQEVAFAFDLALRYGASDRIARWLPILGPHLLNWDITESLCLPALAKAIVGGLLAPLIGISREQSTVLHRAIAEAVHALAARAKNDAPPADKAPKKARRTIHAEYSQFHLEHAKSPPDEVYFQDDRESAQGFSRFATKVGIATPTDTGDCPVELAIGKGKPTAKELAEAVQAVSFPFVVKGPLFVRTVSGGDDEDDEVILPKGEYDVLVRFIPRRAAKEDAEAGLRSFTVRLDFYPARSLDAPKCLKLEHGKPPKTLFLHE